MSLLPHFLFNEDSSFQGVFGFENRRQVRRTLLTRGYLLGFLVFFRKIVRIQNTELSCMLACLRRFGRNSPLPSEYEDNAVIA
jgi:hypothetical protein